MFPLQRGAATWLLLLLTTLALCSGNGALAADSNQRVVCYYTNWSVYRPGTAKFTPQNINPYLCTHLIYSFGGFTKENTLKPYDKYQDIEQGGFAKFTGLKTYNKNLKTLLAIGGWNEGSSRFSPLVADAERRAQFVKNSIKFLRQNHFDGLDLDWEYPAFRDGSKPKDRENYAQLVQDLREEFERESSKTGRPRLLLTMAVPAGIEYVEKGYDVPKLNKYLDWFNLLTYDYHSAYEPAVNHHSPLFSLEEASEYNFDSELNIDYSVKFYLNAGADRDKLVLGIPTYGRSYTLYNPDATDIGAPADGPGEQGDATREKGYLAYYEICTSLKEGTDWTVVQPNPKAMGPYAYKGNQWVGYDDEAIARRKAKYVAENGLGGIMFWSIDNDDFRGTCHGKPYPIIEAAKEALLASTEVGVNDIAAPSRPRKPSRSRSRPGSTTRNRVNTDNNNEIKASFKTSQGRKVARPSRVTTTSTTTTTTTEGSLYIGGRTTTPQPPTTPDPGADFKCEDEGFFPHPRDCKKYFWCLDSPSLGLVAHQFTCPSGLVFNKLADSCDYARNVICSKTAATTSTPASTTTSTTSTTTTTTASPRTTSTTQRARISLATNRSNFFNRAATSTTSTTTEPTVEADYSDEEEDNVETQPEEDPKVIKELIALIKKVGGIEELEKQLQAQEDGSIVLKDNESDQISTTPPTISKSLYERVLSRTGNAGLTFRPAITFNQSQKPERTAASPENKYSSVVRNSYTNSRVGPQNEGLDQLPEFEGVFKEKPKYVTLNRARPTKVASIEDRYDDDDEIDEEENQPSTFEARQPTTSPKYVSIRRQRPTVPAAEQEQDVQQQQQQPQESSERDSSAGQVQYSTVNRNRFRTTAAPEPAPESDKDSQRPLPSRYNTIDRRRTASAQYTSSRLQEAETDDVGTDSSLLVSSTDFQTIYTTASTTTTDAPPPSEPNLIPYSTRQYSNVERGSSSSSSSNSGSSTGSGNGGNSNSVTGSNTLSSRDSSSNSNDRSSYTTGSGSASTTESPISQFSYTITTTSATSTLNSNDEVEPQQPLVLSTDYQTEATVADTEPSLDGADLSTANRNADTTLEVTTAFNPGESVTGGSVGGVDAGGLQGTDALLVVSTVRSASDDDGSEEATVGTEATGATTTGAPPPAASTAGPVLTNDAAPNSIPKFPTRTRKPTTTTLTTTTTTSPETVTNPSREVASGGAFAPIKGAPRPFAAGGVRRTRPTRLPTTTTTTTVAAGGPAADADTATTLRSVKVPPQFRPSLRRPSAGGNGQPNSSAPQPTTRATTVRTKSTRRSEVASASGELSEPTTPATPATTATSLLGRRRRPTASYLSKLASSNRQRTSTVTSASVVEATTTSGTRYDRPKPSGGLRRKYGGPSRTGSSTAAGSESATLATTTTTTSTGSGSNQAPEPAARPSNALFKRRNNGSPLTRTTTPVPEVTPAATGPAASSKFYGKSKYRPGTLVNSVQPATATTVPPVTLGLPDGDQDIEPSIRQNNKLYNAKNRYQQIGEAREDPASLEQELLDAITTISRAPLPITSTPTARPGYEDLKEQQQPPQPVAVEQQYPAGANQRATTHRYNITHEYPYPLGYTAPSVSTSTRRSQKLVQRPRIATQSQYYYQQANPGGVYYTSPIATATISPRQDTTQPARKRKPAVFEKTHSGAHEGTGGRSGGGDGFTGRTYRPSPLDYDYYDDGDARVIGKSNSQVKVIMHGPGIIECLDQGNFPHPLSCKKFISCAKMEIGGVIGWEYTCPKGLSYDPVGGICNWSAGLGCKD